MPVRQNRSATEWLTDDLVLRISVGLEDPADLQADIEAFFADIVDRTKNSTVGLAN